MISVLKGMKDRHSDDVKKYDFIVDIEEIFNIFLNIILIKIEI